MTYVMSDLHGMYDRFIAMLEKIDFSDSDELFIIGDIIDRGERPVDILEYVMDKPNITVLLGNHEVMARDFLRRLTAEITDENTASFDNDFLVELRFLYKGIIINHNKKPSQPTLKRRFFKKKAAFFHGPVWERSGADFILKRKGEFF